MKEIEGKFREHVVEPTAARFMCGSDQRLSGKWIIMTRKILDFLLALRDATYKNETFCFMFAMNA